MSELPSDFGDAEATTLHPLEPAAPDHDRLFSPRDVYARIEARVPMALPAQALDVLHLPSDGDHSLNDWVVAPEFLSASRIAAVLIGLVERGDALHVLLTKRAGALRVHSGQIAFPGGKMDASDASPAATALREAEEEIGIPAGRIHVLGYLPPYLTGSGFRVVPVLARIDTPFEPVLNPGEVDELFEVPFAFLMNEANHELRQREWKGKPRHFYAMPYGERQIWGITAGILRALYERLYR
ncbi:MAG: CoA pyrophosphatase [Beijerinckiaceae bacterium]|nr:CoA pyrophosphatase [Beijerinckiaceae bacterium]